MDKDLLKKKLHEQIDAIDDELTLQMLHEAAAEYETKKSAEDELTTEQLARLMKSLESAEKGNTVPHEEAMKRIKGWFSK